MSTASIRERLWDFRSCRCWIVFRINNLSKITKCKKLNFTLKTVES